MNIELYCIKYKIWLFFLLLFLFLLCTIGVLYGVCMCIWLVWQMKSKYCFERIDTVHRDRCHFACFIPRSLNFTCLSQGVHDVCICILLLQFDEEVSYRYFAMKRDTFIAFHFISFSNSPVICTTYPSIHRHTSLMNGEYEILLNHLSCLLK